MKAPIELILGKVIENSNLEVNYHFGDNEELQKFLAIRQNRKGTRIAYGDLDSITKSPLIWLNVGEKSPLKVIQSINFQEVRFDNVRLIISCSTKDEWLNPLRWEKNLSLLEDLEISLYQLLNRSKYVHLTKGSWTSYKLPKIAINNENMALDMWDAIVIDLSLIVNLSCLKEILT